ncbi:MAG: hypothetical protein ACE5J3_02690 [Methanosarcinales archaeon]
MSVIAAGIIQIYAISVILNFFAKLQYSEECKVGRYITSEFLPNSNALKSASLEDILL